jgi:hypothetical protein
LISTSTRLAAMSLSRVSRILLIHDIHTMADAVCARDIYRLALVAAAAFRWNEPKRKLARMQAETNLWLSPGANWKIRMWSA